RSINSPIFGKARIKLFTSPWASGTVSFSFFATYRHFPTFPRRETSWVNPIKRMSSRTSRDAYLRNSHAVDETKTNHLCAVALFARNLVNLFMHDLSRESCVHIAMSIEQSEQRCMAHNAESNRHNPKEQVRKEQKQLQVTYLDHRTRAPTLASRSDCNRLQVA